jgi:hypothetical protein
MKNHSSFSRRGPDYVSEELVATLSEKASFEFKALFLLVHAKLRARKAASGGEDMLRLRTYEKLQSLVLAGVVTKTGKEYRGDATGLARLAAATSAADEKMNTARAARAARPASLPVLTPKLTATQQGRRKAAKPSPTV